MILKNPSSVFVIKPFATQPSIAFSACRGASKDFSFLQISSINFSFFKAEKFSFLKNFMIAVSFFVAVYTFSSYEKHSLRSRIDCLAVVFSNVANADLTMIFSLQFFSFYFIMIFMSENKKKQAELFLKSHNFDCGVSVGFLTDRIFYDMNLGLFGGKEKSGQDMFKTWILPPEKKPKNQNVIVIDAGGTNFRSCLVSFDSEGEFSISDFKKTRMPGLEKELSKDEFFNQIADNIDYLRDKADRIGFCFSYAMKITKDGDGIPNAFSKEVKAPEVLGCPVGKTLAEKLYSRGWNKIQKIVLLNDTEAALLAGKSAAKNGTEFSSYIGFILGTGVNAAYVQPAVSLSADEKIEKQIIVCESGKCDKLPLSDFDLAMDKKCAVPKQYQLEKQESGAYLGPVALEILLFAAKEKLLSEFCAQKIMELKKLSLIEMDDFLYAPFADGTVSSLCENDGDREIIFTLFDALITRSAKNAAAILCANAKMSGEGKNCLRPIGILCNGTTFYKTHKLRERVETYLENYLTGELGIHYEILTLENDITLGAAVAASAKF